MDVLQWLGTADIQNRRCQIDVQDHLLCGSAGIFHQPRIPHDEGDANRLLIGPALVHQPVLSPEVAVVAGIDDDNSWLVLENNPVSNLD